MRVLQLVKYFPPWIGGVEAVAKDISESMAEIGVQADVLCAHSKPWSTVEHCRGYTVYRRGSFARILSTPLCPTLPLAFRSLAPRYDVIHLHHPDPMATLALFLVRPACPIVVHWHSDIVRQVRTMHLFRKLQDWMLRRADAVIATSDRYASSSKDLAAYRSKTHVVPIGIVVNRLQENASVARTIRDTFGDRKLVLSVGRLAYYKGLHYLVDAVASLPDDVGLLICGDGPLKASLERRINEAGVAHRVWIHSGVGNAMLGGYYAAADMFCLSSTERSEAFGIVQLEAMAFGKPVVATAIPGSGVPWVNQHGVTGLNVEPGSAAKLAVAIRTILDDRVLKETMGENAKQRVLRYFTRSQMANGILTLYRTLGLAP